MRSPDVDPTARNSVSTPEVLALRLVQGILRSAEAGGILEMLRTGGLSAEELLELERHGLSGLRDKAGKTRNPLRSLGVRGVALPNLSQHVRDSNRSGNTRQSHMLGCMC